MKALFLGTCLLAGMAWAGEESPALGRLFFTPAERASLDFQRRTGATEAAPGNALRLEGIVRNRANGRSTVWLNGRPWHEARELTGVVPSAADPAAVSLATGEGRRVPLRVGESANRQTGETRTSLGNGQVTVNRR